MATRETKFQSELVKDMKAKGMHAFKASHQYSTGVLDLYVRCKGVATWIECKFIKIDESFRTQKVSMTTPQFAFARRELEAGGNVAKIIGYTWSKRRGHDQHGLFLCSPEHQDTQVIRPWLEDEIHPSHVIKVRGFAWPVDVIMSRIHLMGTDVSPYAHQEREE
ncbi:MAG: hypothetical protein ACR2QF_02695 [Geminicoccaceae bacterium]